MESHTRGVGAAEHHEAFKEFFRQVQLCEEGGMDFVWLSEHHFTPQRSFGSASMVMAGAVSAATERIKVGSAVVVLPTHNPLHVAEEVSVLDHLTSGRFEFGVGRSGGVGAYRGFNMDDFLSALRLLNERSVTNGSRMKGSSTSSTTCLWRRGR
jgi:alkanesulfonate monooxygenase SsuD/methylene tetrahydromethanopterin reductase-like flavin-dependent oxidoreductase (luciferase family)